MRAVQLMSLLSDLQPSNTTSPFTKVDYGYNVFNTSGNMPLAVPVINIPDLPVSRWVLAAWSISNSFTALTLEEGDAQDRRDMLLGNFTQLQPQQVSTANTLHQACLDSQQPLLGSSDTASCRLHTCAVY